MRALVLLSLLGAGCLDLGELDHLHDLSAQGVGDLGVLDLAAPSFAWTPPTTGMAWGEVKSLAYVNGTLYAPTYSVGLWRSTDLMSWTLVGTPARDFYQIVAITSGSTVTLFASAKSGVWSSTDSGASWTQVSSLPFTSAVSFLAAGGADLYAASTTTIARSIDAGASWQLLNDSQSDMGVPPASVAGMLAASDGTLYVGGGNGHVYAYRGGAWSDITPSGASKSFNALALTPSGALYVAGSAGALYETNDPTAAKPSWTPVPLPGMPAAKVEIQALGADSDGTVYAAAQGVGRWVITSGATASSPITDATSQAIDAIASGPSGEMIASGPFGVAVASPAAGPFTSINKGLYNSFVTALASSPASRTVVYAGTLQGQIASTSNAGQANQAWTTVTVGTSPGQVNAIVAGPNTKTLAYAATMNGLFKTINTGTTWTNVAGLPPPITGVAIDLDPNQENTVYAATSAGVWKSTDGTSTWALLDGSPVAATALLATPGHLYAATTTPDGDLGTASFVQVSTNGGATWVPLDANLPGIKITQLAASLGADGDVLYAATNGDGVYKHTGAKTNTGWVTVNTQLSSTTVTGIAVSADTPSLVVASTTGGVYLSLDAAKTWHGYSGNPPSNPPLPNPYVTSIAVTNGTVFAGTAGNGVYTGQ